MNESAEKIDEPEAIVPNISISEKLIFTSDHKLPINSIQLIDESNLITLSNDCKVKIYGITKNFIFHQKS